MRIWPAAKAMLVGLTCSAAALAQGVTPPPTPTGGPMAPVQTLLPIYEAAGIMGRPVRGADDNDIGRIVDVIVDQVGQPRAAVIDFGGFLGVGNRRIAVDWSALRFAPGNDAVPVRLALTPDQLKAAPEYKESLVTPPAIVAPPAVPQGANPSPDTRGPEKAAPPGVVTVPPRMVPGSVGPGPIVSGPGAAAPPDPGKP